MFNRIANRYDLLNRLLSFGVDESWRRALTAGLGSPRLVADVACGTFDVTLAVLKAHPAARVVGIDPAVAMLKAGSSKLAPALNRTLAVGGDGLALPLKDASVDAVTIAFGIRNIPNRLGAFREFHRVLAPGGRLGVLEFGSAQGPVMGGVYNFYLKTILPFIGGIVSGDDGAYRYLASTIVSFPKPQALADEMRLAGFDDVGFVKRTAGVVYIHAGRKPSL